jgi:hypothetical protein
VAGFDNSGVEPLGLIARVVSLCNRSVDHQLWFAKPFGVGLAERNLMLAFCVPILF